MDDKGKINVNVRKAETLSSLQELGISTRVSKYLERTYGSIGNIVKMGRDTIFNCFEDRDPSEKSSKYIQELVPALKKAGFIRPATDFNRTFAIASLYRVVFEHYKDYFPNNKISALTNEEYESFTSLTDAEVESVRLSLHESLPQKRQYDVICCCFGINDGRLKSPGTAAQEMQRTVEWVRSQWFKAVNRLRRENTLPAIFEASDEIDASISKLKNEFYRLHQDPIFHREREIVLEIGRLRRLPFKDKVETNGDIDLREIDELEISVRTYNCLRRAGVMTISDVINLPNDDWFKIKFLGFKGLEEVINQVRLAGYDDFNVDVPPTIHFWPC